MMNVNRKNDSMKKILVWGLLAVLGIACYDDLGNYDYNDINDMVLEMPQERQRYDTEERFGFG